MNIKKNAIIIYKKIKKKITGNIKLLFKIIMFILGTIKTVELEFN
jgi:hypothetical protein